MLLSHSDAENRYSEIRSATLRAAQNALNQRPEYGGVILSAFDNQALIASKTWRGSTNRRVDWDWFEGYTAFKFRYPKRFELAVWHKNELASLTLGRPTYNGTALRLDFIEANPNKPAELKVFPITLFVMLAYAEALGAEELRVMNPINDSVKQYYEGTGLIYVPKGDYLYMRL